MANIWEIDLKQRDTMEKYNFNSIRKDLKIVYSDNGSISLVFKDNNILNNIILVNLIILYQLQKLFHSYQIDT